MFFSFSSFISTLVFSSILIIAITLLLRGSSTSIFKYIKYLAAMLSLLIIRIFIPLEFHASYNINSDDILPFIMDIFSYQIPFVQISISTLLILIWVTVSLTKLLYYVVTYSQLKRILDRFPSDQHLMNHLDSLTSEFKNTHKIKVIRLDRLSSPLITGFKNPIIIFPDIPFSDNEILYIMRHELQHFTHKDNWIKASMEFLCILYWWNPFIIILRKQLTKVCEINADLQLTQKLTETERIEYLECLLNVARYQQEHHCFSFAFSSKEDLKQRYHVILNPDVYTKKEYVNFAGIAMCILILILSYTFIISPYILSYESQNDGSVEITPENAFIVYDGAEYDIYIDNVYFSSFSEQIEYFPDIEIYSSLEEALSTKQN